MAETISGRIGNADRALRFALGAVLLGFAVACPWAAELGASVQWIAGIVGVVMAATAAIRFCPLYRVLGICTG